MIPATFRASLAYLLRHPWQLLLALLGISVGVAVIVAVDIANSSARKAFLLSMDTITGAATHQIIGGPRGINEAVYRDLRVQHGIDAIAPIVDGNVSIDTIRFSLLGVDLFAEVGFRNFTGDANTGTSAREDRTALFSGFLTTPGAVAMSEQTARDLQLSLGERFTVLVDGTPREAELLATFADGGTERLLVTDIATAQEWLLSPGYLSRIDVRIDATDDTTTLAELEAILPPDARVLSAAGRTRATVEMTTAFMTNLTAMSLLALLVGLFLIFNSVNFSVLQRRALIGTLRALGLTRRQLLVIVLLEAAVLGLVAATLGVLLGILLGEQLVQLVARTINDLYFRVSVTDIHVDSFTVLKGMLAGVLAALLAALLPAYEATTYPPRLAMTRSTLEQRARQMLPLTAMAGIALMLAAALLIVASGSSLLAGLIAVFLAIFGFALCVPLGVRFAARHTAPAAAAVGGTSARLAVAGIVAGLSRTAVAIVALTIAVAATIGVSVMVDSFRGSVKAWLAQSLRADVYVGTQREALDQALVQEIGDLDGVNTMSTRKRVWIEGANGRTELRVFELPAVSYAGFELLDADAAAVWPLWESGDAVLVSEPYGYKFRLRAGDSISLPTDRGRREFQVLATFQSYDVDASGVVMSRGTYLQHFDDDSVDALGVYLGGDVTADDFVHRIETLQQDWPDIYVASNARLRDESMRVFDRTFVITDVLYWLTLGVAFIGILSAMLALQLERARESATLRALGMTPLQVGSLITAQSGAIGILSGIAAVPLGVLMAWLLIKVINRRAFGWKIDMTVAPSILLLTIAFALGAALLAGIYPAYRAGQSQPAIAMREE